MGTELWPCELGTDTTDWGLVESFEAAYTNRAVDCLQSAQAFKRSEAASSLATLAESCFKSLQIDADDVAVFPVGRFSPNRPFALLTT